MTINLKILGLLKSFDIQPDDGLTCLLALHYNLRPTFIPDSVLLKLQVAKIIRIEGSPARIVWIEQLFEENSEIVTDNFAWVKTEYVQLFKERNSKKGTHAREATARMKKLFADNPDIRKDEVLQATQNYLFATDPNYIKFPHYFITKGSGKDRTYDILSWIDRLREQKQQFEERFGNASTMQ